MNHSLIEWLTARLGRRTAWRLGRAFYLEARGDLSHWIDLSADGERLLQRRMLEHSGAASGRIVVFDIGANVGDWTIALLDQAAALGLAERIEVHAFEPVPATLETLRRRLTAHTLGGRVRVVPQAVSSAAGACAMFIAGPNQGTNSLHDDPLRPGLPRIEVQATTVDDYTRSLGLDRIHYLKCDAEGHDMEVLLGARAAFAAGRVTACQFEYNLRWVYARHFLKDAFDFAATIPYRLGKVTPQGIETFRGWHPELERFFDGNYVLLHR
ncbi:MAG: FkbM family methyltransferase, partial [Candidatus Eiseniibacteriota bacterium]